MQIRFPGVTCAVCGQPLPPGSEAEVHPTLRGPQGGKKYYHSQHGAQGNTRRRAKRGRSNGSKGITIFVDLEMDNEADTQGGGPGNREKDFIPQHVLEQAENERDAFDLVGDYVSEETGWLVAGTDEISARKIKQAVAVKGNPKVHRMSDDEFDQKYDPLDPPSGESYWTAQEIQGQKKNHVWTVLDVDDELFIVPGIHRVNQFGFMLTRFPWRDKNIQVKWT